MDVIAEFASLFAGTNRLYTLEGSGSVGALQVERWIGHECLSRCYQWDVYALSTDPSLDLEAMLGELVTVSTHLPGGGIKTHRGRVAEATFMGYDAGLARYHLKLVPGLWTASLGHDQRTFVDKTVADILAAVLDDASEIVSWRFTPDANQRIAAIGPIDYVVQPRTQDNLDFLCHVLADAGMGFYFEDDPNSTADPVMVIFDDSAQLPDDDTSAQAGGVAYRYSASAAEAPNTIQVMGEALALLPDRLTLLSSNYLTNQSVVASAPLVNENGARELYDVVGPEIFADTRQAEETALRHAQAIVAQAETWVGYSTLFTAQSGRAVHVLNAPWTTAFDPTDPLSGSTPPPVDFLITEVQHLGINNLPSTVMEALERTLGPAPHAAVDPELLKQAKAGGYANHFRAVPQKQVWRPTLADGTGQRLNPVPTALGAQTARVGGPQGETGAGASGPVYTDGLGRLYPIYHWQDSGDTGTYPTRSMQRLASDGHGMHLTSWIGHEVLTQYQFGLLHRPIILGALYNGRGEGGASPTPGGAAGAPVDASIYQQATDRLPSGQANLAGGNSLAWHGAGADGHNHPGALSGFKSQGFDGQGSNQLVADDSDGMGRLQMASSWGATQLNLGHLRHQADNYLGSFTGQGFQLRSDHYGAVKGSRGTLLSSRPLSQANAGVGDVTAAQVLLTQQLDLAKAMDQVAEHHLTLPFAAQRGVLQPNQSQLNAKAAPLQALDQSFKTTVSGENVEQGLADAPNRATDKAIPHTGDAILGIDAQDSQALLAGQALQWSAGETLTVGSGQDINLAVDNQLRIHSEQGISWLGGAEQVTGGGPGLSMISGKHDLDIQAQHDVLGLRSKSNLTVASANANVALTAAKTIHMAVIGGAHITIEGGNIQVNAPGKITAYAARYRFIKPAQMNPRLPQPGDPTFGGYLKGFSA